ncbi:hypothetical protein K8Q98_02620 [Candidatus Nomurabacteria bacterium]|nr:hypothetical protein [Candidatus Nomurabacteria bacterium]
MVTPELKEYIRGELAKGRVREDIEKSLLVNGWSPVDCSDAFKAVTVVQSFVGGPVKRRNFSWLWKTILTLLILGVICFTVWYFFRAPIIDLWNSYMGTEKIVSTEETIPQNIIVDVPYQSKDCGTTAKPDLKVPSTYENNEVLNCLSNSLATCDNSRGVFKHSHLPDIFEIIKDGEKCNFKISYGPDTLVTDPDTKEKLSGKYISCPVSVVSIFSQDTTSNTFSFVPPSLTGGAKYVAEIYSYGIGIVFTENNFNQSKIENKGCSGSYIKYVIDRYLSTKPTS